MELETRRKTPTPAYQFPQKNSLFSDKLYFTHDVQQKTSQPPSASVWDLGGAHFCMCLCEKVCVRARRSRLVIISCMCFIIPFQKLHSIER
jgi:hypothetical protein